MILKERHWTIGVSGQRRLRAARLDGIRKMCLGWAFWERMICSGEKEASEREPTHVPARSTPSAARLDLAPRRE